MPPIRLNGVAMFNYILLPFKNSRIVVFCIKALRIPNAIIPLLQPRRSGGVRRGSAAARLLGLRVRISAGGMDVCVL